MSRRIKFIPFNFNPPVAAQRRFIRWRIPLSGPCLSYGMRSPFLSGSFGRFIRLRRMVLVWNPERWTFEPLTQKPFSVLVSRKWGRFNWGPLIFALPYDLSAFSFQLFALCSMFTPPAQLAQLNDLDFIFNRGGMKLPLIFHRGEIFTVVKRRNRFNWGALPTAYCLLHTYTMSSLPL